MHINRKPGEQVEVDWAGDPATIIDPDTGEIIKAYIFVGVMTYSQYAYVEACMDAALRIYRTQLEEMDYENGLSSSKESILSSLIHMSCNRVMGNNTWEDMIRALTRNAIYEYKKKYK